MISKVHLVVVVLMAVAGLTPRSQAAESPSLTIGLDAQGRPELNWTAISNQAYTLEYRTNLAMGSWQAISATNVQVVASNQSRQAHPFPPVLPTAYFRLRADRINPFGAHVSQGRRPDMPSYLHQAGASWARVNAFLDGNDPPFAAFLEAGINLVITFAHRDPVNVKTNFGTLGDWPNAGFPFRTNSAFQQRIQDSLRPLLPYLGMGFQVWVQCENEIGDAAVAPTGKYWRGTTSDYLANLQACYEAVRALSPSIPVVLTSFASENLDTVLNPGDPNYAFQTNRIMTLLASGQYDAADLHFYGCVTDIPAKIQWVKDRLAPGKKWITTENAGPDYRCPATPIHYTNNPALFETAQSGQVTNRFNAAITNGAALCLWFSLFDLQNESDVFNHLGLLDPSTNPPQEKPAFGAFRSYTAGH